MNNNKQLLKQLYVEMYDKLYTQARKFHHGNRQQAEDSLHYLFLNLATVDDTTDIKNPKAFLRMALHNACKYYFTTSKNYMRRLENFSYFLKAHEFVGEASDEICAQLERQEQVAQFANSLPNVQRQVFLGILAGKSIREMSEEFGSAYNTIKHNRRLIVEKLDYYFNNTLKEEFNYERISVS